MESGNIKNEKVSVGRRSNTAFHVKLQQLHNVSYATYRSILLFRYEAVLSVATGSWC